MHYAKDHESVTIEKRRLNEWFKTSGEREICHIIEYNEGLHQKVIIILRKER
ncbi:MAG: hypothetical protein ACRCX2_27945 [Paraclostridium sp.]